MPATSLNWTLEIPTFNICFYLPNNQGTRMFSNQFILPPVGSIVELIAVDAVVTQYIVENHMKFVYNNTTHCRVDIQLSEIKKIKKIKEKKNGKS